MLLLAREHAKSTLCQNPADSLRVDSSSPQCPLKPCGQDWQNEEPRAWRMWSFVWQTLWVRLRLLKMREGSSRAFWSTAILKKRPRLSSAGRVISTQHCPRLHAFECCSAASQRSKRWEEDHKFVIVLCSIESEHRKKVSGRHSQRSWVGEGGGRAGYLANAGPNLGFPVANKLTRATLALVAAVVGLESRLCRSSLEWRSAGGHHLLLVGKDELYLGIERPLGQSCRRRSPASTQRDEGCR